MNFPPPSDRQARVFWFCLTAFSIAVVLALIGLLCWGTGWVLNLLSPVLLPLAVGAILAYLLDPIVDFIEVRKIPRSRAILLVFFVGAALVLGLLATVVPRLAVETQSLVQQVPEYSRNLRARIESSELGRRLNQAIQFSNTPAITTNTIVVTPEGIPLPVNEKPTSATLSEKIISFSSEILPAIGAWLLAQVKTIGSWLGLLIGFFLVPVYVFYFLKEKSGIQSNWTNYLPIRDSKIKEEVIFILSSINDSLIVFFRGQVLVALCSGVLLTIAFSLMGLKYAVLLGVMAGVLGIIPYLGVMISMIPALALAVVQFGDWWHPVIVLGIFAMVNMLEGLVISPKIIGDRVGLHPLTIIVAVMVGTTLMGGILGGMLAIPLTAALRAIMFRYVWKKRGT